MKKVLLVLALLHFIFNVDQKALAQTTQASISGTVLDDQSKPLNGASVTVRNESTGFTNTITTNAKGEYTFKELPLGGPYTVLIKFTGFAEEKREVQSLNQGDALKVNIAMRQASQQLDSVTVSASRLRSKVPDLGAATSITPHTIKTIPVNGRNFSNLADLSPLSNGGNLMSQLSSGTNYTIDGMTAKNPTSAGPTTSRTGAPYSMTIEAVREFKVVTNQYDVTLGRSGGGSISAVSKSGTNTLTGSVFVYGRANWLSNPYDIRGNKRPSNNDYSTYQYGFSLGGPIIKNKLHFFVAWDHQQDNRSLVIADIRTPADEQLFNITTNVLDTIVAAGRKTYGLGSSPQYGAFPKKRSSDAGFLRLDLQINNKNLLTIRDNFNRDLNKLGDIDNTSLNLYESAGNEYTIDNSFLVSLRTSINSKFTNELKLQHLYTWQNSFPNDQLPSQNIPRAIIRGVSSVLTSGAVRATDVQMGGFRFAQEHFRNNVFQFVDNLYFNTDKIKYTFGIDAMYTRAHSLYGSEVNGRFEYQGLQNFINNTPYRFYREVPIIPDPSVFSNIYNIGLYGQMQTKLATGLELTAGVRLDYAHYPTPQYNQLVYDELKLRTDNKFKSYIVQPRLQFVWDVNENHRDYIKLGAGVFSSDINNYMVINNLVFDGKHSATVDMFRKDVPAGAFPTPDFVQYRKDPSSVPTMAGTPYQLPTINMNGKDLKVPVVYKGNISYTRYITDKLKVGITGYVTLGRNNYFYVDRNMSTIPYFTLPEEANRGVYVPLNTMDVTAVSPNWLNGRISNKLGRVLELISEGKVNQYAFVFDASYRYFKDGEINFSYTWNDAKDNESFNGNVANTATLSLPVKDDPRNLSKMSYSDNQFRHKIVFYGTAPSFYGVVIGVRFSGIGGTRYSLLSGVNSNGDFVDKTNDLAFIFNRNNPNVPQNVRDGIQKILDNPNASNSIKNYLNKYSGAMAERNGGVNGFYGVFDLHIAKNFRFYKKNGIEISADIFNVANLFNKKWGVNKALGNQTLYSSKQFVPDANDPHYVYSVNSSGVPTPSGNPYQFQIGLRYNF